MLIFELRDMTPIEAFVLAPDQNRAIEIFKMHVAAHGGDPDSLLFRQWQLQDIGEPERCVVMEALALDREGLLSSDVGGRWAFVTPPSTSGNP